MKNINILDSDESIAESNYALVRAWVEYHRDEPVRYDVLVDLDELDESMLVDEIISVLDGTLEGILCGHIHGWNPQLADYITLLEIKLL